MLIPIRCFTCGKVIGDVSETRGLKEQSDAKDRATSSDVVSDGTIPAHIKRICCKRMLITAQDVGLQMCNFPFQNFRDTTSSFDCEVSHARIVKCD